MLFNRCGVYCSVGIPFVAQNSFHLIEELVSDECLRCLLDNNGKKLHIRLFDSRRGGRLDQIVSSF